LINDPLPLCRFPLLLLLQLFSGLLSQQQLHDTSVIHCEAIPLWFICDGLAILLRNK
jgi:hypothetical protein